MTEAAAGATLPCRCGRALVVPSFRELRQRSGQPEPEPPPEMVIESLLLANRLPEDCACVLCGTWTDRCVSYRTICEQASVETGDRPWWQILLAALTFGWLGALIFAASRQPEREVGTDHVFSLPLRVCDRCVPQLTTVRAVKEAMARTAVYRRLLEKYPDALIELAER